MSCCDLVIVGGKAGALIAYEIVRAIHPQWKIGFLNYFFDKTKLSDPNVVFFDGDIDDHYGHIKSYFVATGANRMRHDVTQRLIDEINIVPINVIHPRATISPSVRLGYGNLICCSAVVHTNATVGNGCIINTNAVVEHDNVIGDYCQISPGAVLCGYVEVGDFSFISANATIIPAMTIAANTVIGAGAVLLEDITQENCMYAGVPAKLKKHENPNL